MDVNKILKIMLIQFFRTGSKLLSNKHKLQIISKPLCLWTDDQSRRIFPQTIVSTDK